MAHIFVQSQNPLKQLKSVGFEKRTVSTSAVALASIPATATSALIVCESNAVRWRCDAAPTATDGSPLAANDSLFLDSRDALLDAEFIRSGGADGTLQVVYFK